MKKHYSVFFIFLVLIISITCLASSKKIEKVSAKDIEIKSGSALLMDANTKTIIYQQNEYKRMPIASMCKIMTLLICFDSIKDGSLNLDENFVISQNAAGMGGSQVFLEANGEYKASELIKSIVIASANDACVAMAERICGSEELFVDKMNERAKSLGMDNTCFTNCTGLPKGEQFSCAKDVAVMFGELLKHNEYYKFSNIWMDKITHPKDRITEISNTNKLIKHYQGCDSGKTGYTAQAGHCLAASALRNGMRLISIVINAPDSKTRFHEASSLFNYGFNNYTNKLVIDDKKPLDVNITVKSGKKTNLTVLAENPLFIFAKKGEKVSVEVNFEPLTNVKAPVLKGDIVGKLVVYKDAKEIGIVNVIAGEDILEQTYFDCVKDIINNWALVA